MVCAFELAKAEGMRTMPVPTANQLNCKSTANPTSACKIRNAAACFTLTWPEGIGRERVRSTRPSMPSSASAGPS